MINSPFQSGITGVFPRGHASGNRFLKGHLALTFCLFGMIAVNGAEPASDIAEDLFSIETWSSDRGLPQNSVNAFLQSHDGYLWLGTYNGVVRFDGIRFEVFDSANTPAMRNSRVTSLLEDSQTNLWIGHETGELTRLTDGVFSSVSLSNRWPGGTVQGLGEDEHADLWLLSAGGSVMRLRDGLALPRYPGIGREPGGTPEMIKDQSGRLLVVRNGAVAAIQDGKWLPLTFDNPNTYYSRIYPAREGGLWVAGDFPLRRWQGDGWVQQAGSLPDNISFLTTMTETRSGRMLIGSMRDGLVLHETDGRNLSISTTNGLPDNWVKCIVEDREGNIWVGTRGGLGVLRPRKVVMRSPPDRWQHVQPLGIAAGSHGTVWAGSEGAGLYQFDGRYWRNFGASDGLSNGYVWCVLEDMTGAVWAGTWSGGLFRGRDGKFAVPEALSELNDPITALLESPVGTLWIGTGKGLAQFKDGRLKQFAALGGAAAGDIRALANGRDGEVWLGTLGAGLGRFSDGKLQTYTALDGLPGEFILSLHHEPDGTVWIGTLERGLCRFKEGRFSVLTMKQGLPNNVFGHIADDGHGKLWINSSHGIYSASKADLDRVADDPETEQLPCLVYGISDGLTALAGSAGFTPSGFRASDGRIWFPTAKGLAVVNPAQGESNRLPPPILIEEVLIGGKLASPVPHAGNGTRSVQIPPGSRQIEIQFAALSYSAAEKVRFKWRLEGLENEWSEPKADRHVTYSYLAPGTYVFRVIACNNDGLWNENAATLGLVVLPFFWETWWFKLCSRLFGLLVFGAGIVLALRGRQRRKLERAARERELERERSRIAQDIHDDLGASLTRIGMLSQTASETPTDPERTSRYLAQIYAAAREMTRGMDEIVWAVNPQHDTLESLFNYLTRFAHEFLTLAKIRCRLQVPVNFAERPVRSEIRHNLFLAFKETLHNAVRHSGADEVQVSVTLEGDLLRMVVSDNGRGSNAAPPTQTATRSERIATGHGLTNIQTRLARVGGQSRITSEPGQGLRVELQVSLAGDRSTEKDQPPV